MDQPAAKDVLVLAPGVSVELMQELWDTSLIPTQKDLAVLLPPEQAVEYEHPTYRNNTLGQVEFVASPARSFFSSCHLTWLRGNLRSSSRVMVLLKQSPYEDLTSALVFIVILLISGRGITLLRPNASENGPLLDARGGDAAPQWLAKELSLKALGKEYMALFPNQWEIMYFVMFVFLILKKSLWEKVPFWRAHLN